MTLFRDVLEAEGANCVRAPAREVRGVTLDSRRADAHTAFFACPGATPQSQHGKAFINKAVALGAACIVAEPTVTPPQGMDADLGWFETPKPRQVLATAAEALFGYPSQKLDVIAVTGTNGKSTVTFMLASLLDAAGKRAAVFGTLGTGDVRNPQPSGFTTPEAEVLSDRLRGLVQTGVSAVAMEVSSHALALHRVDGIRIAVAAFTNLSRDHLDFHESLEAYEQAKLRLFRERLAAGGVAVFPAGDPRFQNLPVGTRQVTWAVGGDADVSVVHRGGVQAGHADMAITIAGEVAQVRVPVAGRFNLENIAVASACAVALGLAPQRVFDALPHIITAPGRFEVIGDGAPTVIVDYAHTPDALRRVLEEARRLTRGKVWTVFGCGGDRDVGKRAQMGEVALAADHIVVTDDNPRTEAPEKIRAAVLGGMPKEARSTRDIHEIGAREAAIVFAVEHAAAADVVVVAGKGHETTQTVGEHVLPFDDRAVCRRALAERQKVTA